MRILLVEDQATAAAALGMLLEDDGHEVVLATSIKAALQAIESTCVDTALLDLKLPDGNGKDLIPVLRRRCPETKIILATGSASLEWDQDVLSFEDLENLRKDVSADGCIGKPIDYDRLIRLLET